MKLRKQIRWLYRTLQDQIQLALAEHPHDPFYIKGSGCMLCRLLDIGWPLATLQLARENQIAGGWIPAELELANLIGHEFYKKRVKREMVLVKNLPKKICKFCGGTVIVFFTLSQIAKNLLKAKSNEWYSNCNECGNKLTFTKKDIPIKLLTVVRKRLAAAVKRRKLNKKVAKIDYQQLVQHFQTLNTTAIFGTPASTNPGLTSSSPGEP